MTPDSIRSGTDRIAFVAQQFPRGDIFVNIQGDEPLIEPSMIDATISPLIGDGSVQIGTPARLITDPDDLLNPGVVKVVMDESGNALYFSRSTVPFVRDEQSVRAWIRHHRFFKHIGLYVYRRAPLLEFPGWSESMLERAEKLEQLRFLDHGYRIKVIETEYDSIPVDTAADADRVRSILATTAKVH
jgi:3-deoxy-manno-octulosonate cytidylyltransferase (CMP-KDO synthetase)